MQFLGGHLGVHAMLELDPQARHREEDSGPGTLQVLHKGVQRFRKEDMAAVAQRALLDQHALGHMRQRQVGDVAVVDVHAHAPGGAGHTQAMAR